MRNDRLIKKLLESERWVVKPSEGVVLPPRGKVLGQWDEHNGYYRTEVKIGSRRYRIAIHRIIWIAVHGVPKYGAYINHIDGDRRNNSISNLERSNAAHNTRHAYRLGLCRTDTNHNHRDERGNFAKRDAGQP